MRQLGRALTQQPALASLSVETNLRPKLEWLRELQIPRLADQLDAYPAVLTLSLDANLLPTAAALRQAGLLDDVDGAPTKPTKVTNPNPNPNANPSPNPSPIPHPSP